MILAFDRVQRALEAVRGRGDQVFVEPDGFPMLEAIGIRCPRHVLVADAHQAARTDLAQLPGDRVVVKVASSRVLHRSELGAVAVVQKRSDAVVAAIRAMEARVPAEGRLGFTLNEHVRYEAAFGSELLLGLRWTEDFGPVVTLGAGGVYAEFLARHFRPGDEIAILPAFESDRETLARRLERLPIVHALTGQLRNQPRRASLDDLVAVVQAFAALGRAVVPRDLLECEINPLVVGADGRFVALDVLGRLGRPERPERAPRPLHKIASLLVPEKVALVGVSEGMNPGHVVLDNLLREGYPADDITILKPGVESIDGCRCVPDLASLPQPVDLLVLAVGAAQVPALVQESIARRSAESIVIIPGGLEEKVGTSGRLAPMYGALAEARTTSWQGPVVNGGNCLGIRSRPGRIDTMFIPATKLPPRAAEISPLALISQSGAFAIAKCAKLASLDPKFVITVGNQMDLTVGDYLTYLGDDEDIAVFAVYVEGFRQLDGLRFLAAARRIVASGRSVILYRAGRTAAGAAATASHTASIAGDYAVTRELAASAGVVVSETLEDFEDLVSLFVGLRGREPGSGRLGAVSNAGFECVAMADNIGSMTLASFSDSTRSTIAGVLSAARIDSLVDIHNPLDLTPMADDAAYEKAVRAMLDDHGVDLGLVGCVPLTPALNTLPQSEAHGENVRAGGSVAARLIRLFEASSKPVAVVVDGGALYEPMENMLRAAGVPVFRSADRALRLLDVFYRSRSALRARHGSGAGVPLEVRG
jgi:acyl-CoA synthetase (NDP forming)